jgi:hypothetical protein
VQPSERPVAAYFRPSEELWGGGCGGVQPLGPAAAGRAVWC